MINTIKFIINESKSKYFLGIPELKEKDIFVWNLLNYIYWNKRKENMKYLLPFNHN